MGNSLVPEQPEPEALDYAYSIVKGAVSTIPIAGGVAAEILSLILGD